MKTPSSRAKLHDGAGTSMYPESLQHIALPPATCRAVAACDSDGRLRRHDRAAVEMLSGTVPLRPQVSPEYRILAERVHCARVLAAPAPTSDSHHARRDSRGRRLYSRTLPCYYVEAACASSAVSAEEMRASGCACSAFTGGALIDVP